MLYQKPPILEAVIDFRFSKVDTISDNKSILMFIKKHEGVFVKSEPLHEHSVVIKTEIGAESDVHSDHAHVGYRLTDGSDTKVLQIKHKNFSSSQLKPYTTWSEFRSNTKSLWDSYVEITRVENVERIGLRYINRIDIPSNHFAMEEYFSLYPHMDDQLVKESLSGFFMQVSVPQATKPSATGKNARAIINMGLTPPALDGHTSILLDIDVSAEVQLGSNSNDIWEILNHFRTVKNTLFESSITNQTRGLFK